MRRGGGLRRWTFDFCFLEQRLVLSGAFGCGWGWRLERRLEDRRSGEVEVELGVFAQGQRPCRGSAFARSSDRRARRPPYRIGILAHAPDGDRPGGAWKSARAVLNSPPPLPTQRRVIGTCGAGGQCAPVGCRAAVRMVAVGRAPACGPAQWIAQALAWRGAPECRPR